MTLLLVVVLLSCVLGVVHTYILYPFYVQRGEGRADDPTLPLAERTEWPEVAVLMAVHNEEAVLPEKLASLARQDYPGRLRILIGSDNSSDRTNELLAGQVRRDDRFSATYFTTRQGKPQIVNKLAALAREATVFVLTDASVMLRVNTISELVKPMLVDPALGIVDSTMVQTGGRSAGVGAAEADYIHAEVRIKRAEGRRWGAMIGPFGGCFAIRSAAFRTIPANFIVDDFFLCMAAYESGFRGLASATARVEEGVGQHLRDEFRRKVRIGSGNWQNLVRFRRLWWPPARDGLAFAFFSHKVLRWITPFLLLIGTLAWWGLAWRTGNHWVALSFAFVGGGILSAALLDGLLASVGIHSRRLRKVRYFLAMNLALLVGFWRYITGIRTNVWQPSNRA